MRYPMCSYLHWLFMTVNTASDAQSHLLNKKADMNSASGVISDLEINDWVHHKVLIPESWVLRPL